MHAQGNKCYRLEHYRFKPQLCSTRLHLTSPTWTDISSSPCTVHLHVCHRGMTHLSPPPLHHHCHETPLHCYVLSCTAGQCGTTYTGKQDGAVNAKYRYMSICQAPYLSSMLMTSMQTDVYIPTRGDICTMQELLDTRRTELVPGCTTHTWLGTRLLYFQ